MVKDIFEKDYFDKHRKDSNWNTLKGRSVSKLLNLKSPPKRVFESEPVEENVSEGVVDTEYKETRDTWRAKYFKLVLAGFCGGFLVMIVNKVSLLNYPVWSVDFFLNTTLILFVSLIFFMIFGAIYHMVD